MICNKISNCSGKFIDILFQKYFKSHFHPYLSRHNDLAWLIRENFQNNISTLDLYNMTQYKLKNSTPSHTDITRLREGQVGGQVCFFNFLFLFLIQRSLN